MKIVYSGYVFAMSRADLRAFFTLVAARKLKPLSKQRDVSEPSLSFTKAPKFMLQTQPSNLVFQTIEHSERVGHLFDSILTRPFLENVRVFPLNGP